MAMIKTYRVMLCPNNVQNSRMFATAHTARYAYNWTLALQMRIYADTGKYLSNYEARKLFTEHKKEATWLYEVSNNATKQTIKDCCKAFQRFVAEKNKSGYTPYTVKQISKAACDGRTLTRYDMHGHPKFKKRGRVKPSFYMDTDKIAITETRVRLEKLGLSRKRNKQCLNLIRLAEHGRIPTSATYTNPRIVFDGINWWLSVGVEVKREVSKPAGEGIGVDVGVKALAVISDGDVYININKTQKIRKLKKRQRRLQRKVSRKYQMNMEGESYKKTGNIIKSEKELLKLNQRLNGIRHNHLHQTSADIMKREPSYIVTEDLNIKGMMKNKHLAKAIQEQGIAEFHRQIAYKSVWNGIEHIEAPRYYPSSKTCSVCGFIKTDLKLNDRIYTCECGNIIDRDLNAALNLKAYGAA